MSERYRTDWIDGTTEHRILAYLNRHLADREVFHIEKYERDGKTVVWSRAMTPTPSAIGEE